MVHPKRQIVTCTALKGSKKAIICEGRTYFSPAMRILYDKERGEDLETFLKGIEYIPCPRSEFLALTKKLTSDPHKK